jgi:hypothetical protein
MARFVGGVYAGEHRACDERGHTMPLSESTEPSLRRGFRWVIPALGILGVVALLPASWTTALSQSQSTVPGVPQNVQGAPTVKFTYAPGCVIEVDLPNNLIEGVPQGQQIRVLFNPAPVPPNQAAAGSLGGGNVIPLAPPIDLSLMVRNLSTGVDSPLPSTLAGISVTLRMCVLQNPPNADTQMAWLREVTFSGTFAGYFRDAATFDAATNSLITQVAAGSLSGTLLLPTFIVPAFVANFDASAHIFSSPFPDATDFGVAGPQFTRFKVVAPQVIDRIYVFNEASQGYGWIEADKVGPASP